MRTLLLVAHDFPPDWTSGIFRPVKFAKYLGDFGWNTVVLTVEPRDVSQDYSMLKELPANVSIVRSRRRSLRELENSLHGKAANIVRRNHRAPEAVSPAQSVTPARQRSWFRNAVSKFAAKTRDALWIPDEYIIWYPQAVRVGRKILERSQIDVIMSTSSPTTAHLVGRTLAREFDKPLVLDFRDPWTDNFTRDVLPLWRQRLERRLELRVLKSASKIVHLTEDHMEQSICSFPTVPNTRHCAIHNGYDEADFETPIESSSSPTLRLLNVGTVYDGPSLQTAIEGLTKVFLDSDLATKVTFEHVGIPSSKLANLFRDSPFKEQARFDGLLAHRDAVKRMCEVDAHILTLPKGRTDITKVPGKIYELMRSGKPIIFVGWPSESWTMLEKSGLGIFVSAGDAERFKAVVADLIDRKLAGLPSNVVNSANVARFERRALAGQLAVQLNSLVATAKNATEYHDVRTPKAQPAR